MSAGKALAERLGEAAKRATGKQSGGTLSRLLDYLKPWKLTGPGSHPETRTAVPPKEYRQTSPASQEEAIVPNAEPDRIYDITYYSRDYRRQKSPVMHVNPVKHETIDFSNGPPKEILEQPVPPRPGERAPMQNARIPGAENARVVGIFDDENAGYQS